MGRTYASLTAVKPSNSVSTKLIVSVPSTMSVQPTSVTQAYVPPPVLSPKMVSMTTLASAPSMTNASLLSAHPQSANHLAPKPLLLAASKADANVPTTMSVSQVYVSMVTALRSVKAQMETMKMVVFALSTLTATPTYVLTTPANLLVTILTPLDSILIVASVHSIRSVGLTYAITIHALLTAHTHNKLESMMTSATAPPQKTV